jgi:uncharacterized protein
MNAQTERRLVDGPAGLLEVAIDRPPVQRPVGIALVCHPHPLFAGTLDNKVVQTLARAHLQAGWTVWRFNVRGVGRSEGLWDEGRGEVDDALATLSHAQREAQREAHREGATDPAADSQRLAIAGFSFGGYLAARVLHHLRQADRAVASAVLVAPSVAKFDVPPLPPGSLVVQGGADDVVPMAAVLAWAEPDTQPVVVVPGGGHFFHGQLGLLKQIVGRHLQTLE